jgi:endoglucanase
MTIFMRWILQVVLVFVCGFCVSGAVPAGFPQMLSYKAATNACFEIISPSNVKLTNFIFLNPDARLETAVSNLDNQKFEVFNISFPVNHYSWSEFTVRFMPLNDGEVELKLAGPYEVSPQGRPYRQDNLWDKIEIVGSEIKNPGFEDLIGNRPKDWICLGGVANAGPMSAKEGRNYARTSFDRVLKTQFKVKANTQVTLKLYARSQPPPAYNDMRRILSKTTTAHAAMKGFTRGVSLIRYLDLPQEKNPPSPYIYTDFDLIKSEGFDHVRIPVAWHHYVSAPKYEIPPEFFLKVEYMITNSFVKGLNVIIAWSDFAELGSNPSQYTNLFFAVWQQISDFYTLYPTNLAFELLDSPSEKLPASVLNSIYARTLEIIRRHNPERIVFLGPSGYSVNNLGSLYLPYEDDAIAVCVRISEPVIFTHQGLEYNGLDLKNVKGIVFPGPPPQKLVISTQNKIIADWIEKYNSLPTELNPSSNRINLMKLDTARQWSEFYGRPVYLCGFGASGYADNKSRVTYYSEIRQFAEKSGMGWSINDWKFDFRYIDPSKNQPVDGLHDALFKK